MNNIVKNIIRFILFVLVQAFVLNKVQPLHQFVKPYLYFLFILWMPFNTRPVHLMLIAFLFGITMDYLSGTPGLYTAPSVLIAYLRPFVITILLPQEKKESTYIEPSIKSMGFAPYSVYILMLTFCHHTYLVLIEWIQFGNFLFFIGKVSGTVLISMLLIFVTEMLFSRKGKYRTG